MHVTGFKLPKLGSVEDIIIRKFLAKRANKEIYKNKLLAQIAMSGCNKAEESNAVAHIWNNYVNLETFLEDELAQRDIDLQEEYKYWSKIKSKITKTKEGKLVVTGIKLNS